MKLLIIHHLDSKEEMPNVFDAIRRRFQFHENATVALFWYFQNCENFYEAFILLRDLYTLILQNVLKKDLEY